MSKIGCDEGWSGMAVAIPWVLLIIVLIALGVMWPGLQMICWRGYNAESCSLKKDSRF